MAAKVAVFAGEKAIKYQDVKRGPNREVAFIYEVGKKFGVTERTIRRDGKLAESVALIAENCGAEARRALLTPDHRVWVSVRRTPFLTAML